MGQFDIMLSVWHHLEATILVELFLCCDFVFILFYFWYCFVCAHLNYYMQNSLMEKKAAAVELIKVRLTELPNDPRLWYVFFSVAMYYIYKYLSLSLSHILWIKFKLMCWYWNWSMYLFSMNFIWSGKKEPNVECCEYDQSLIFSLMKCIDELPILFSYSSNSRKGFMEMERYSSFCAPQSYRKKKEKKKG